MHHAISRSQEREAWSEMPLCSLIAVGIHRRGSSSTAVSMSPIEVLQ